MDINIKELQEKFIALIRRGETSKSEFKLGIEIEHIIVKEDTLESVNYYEANGIQDILKALLPLGYEAIYEETYLIGLKHQDFVITLEPGGQLEVSLNARRDLTEIYESYWAFLEQILPILRDNSLWLLAIGYHPKSSIKDIPFNPKKRYQHMSAYLEKTGRYAHHMMKGTASMQIVIDYQDEADFIRKFRVAHFLMPFLALLSDNAPYFEGQLSTQHSIRTAIWDEMDPERSGLIPGALDGTFGYPDYANYLLGIRPILIQKEDQLVNSGDTVIRDLEGLPNFSDAETDHLMSMVFPDVRVRSYIEIRMADSLPLPLSFGFAASVKNLFYHESALNALYQRSLKMSDAQLVQLRQDMKQKGYEATFEGTSIQQLLREMLQLAKEDSTPQERLWIEPLETMVSQKETAAMITMRRMETDGHESNSKKALEWCAAHTWKKEMSPWPKP